MMIFGNLIQLFNFWIPAFCLGAFFFFLYKDAFSMLINTWSNMPTYSHGFLIPLVSLYFIWLMRYKLFAQPIRPNATGAFITIAACLLLIFGKISAVGIIQQISILIMICGLIVLLLGTKFMKILALPVGYLILMLPLFDVLISKIQWPFQLLSANMAVKALRAMNIPVYIDSNFIELPGVTLQVAKACSGIQYLISIIAITIPLMIIFLKNKRSRLLLFISAVLIGITANWLRVVLISLWAYYGRNTLHGPGHIFQGMFVSVFGFVFLFFIALLLSRNSDQNTYLEKKNIALPLSKETKSRNLKNKILAWFTAILILSGTAGYIHMFSVVPIQLSRTLVDIPGVITDWHTFNEKNPLETHFQIQGADKILARRYQDSSGFEVILNIGYFESQIQGKELVHYTLQKLYDNSSTIEISDNSKSYLRINYALLEEKNAKYLVFYWYNINGRHLTNNIKVKLHTASEGFLFKKTNGAVIIVSAEMKETNNESVYFKKMIGFILDAKPFIEKYLPPNNSEKG